MSIIAKFKQFISPDGQVAQNELPMPFEEVWTKHSFTPIVNWTGSYKMWKSNPVAQACTITYSLMMPEAQLGVITPSGYDYDQPIVSMLTRNQWRVTMAEVMTILCIGGNAYGYKLRNASGAVIGIRWYSDKWFAPVNDGWGDVDYYHYYNGAVTYRVEKSDVVHIVGFWYDPEKPLGGGSPVELAAQSIEGYNEASATVFNIHKNDAMPKTLLVYDEELSGEQASLAQKSFSRKYGGERRGSVGIVWGVKDVKRLALDWNELGLSDTFGQYETRICGAYKVHPIIAGTHMGLSQSTYSNFEQASKDFTNMVRVPFWNMLADQINAQLALPDYGVQIGFDLSTVQALAGDVLATEAVSTQDNDINDDNDLDNSDGGAMPVEARGFRGYESKTFDVTVGPETKAWLQHPDSFVYAKAYDDTLKPYDERIGKSWAKVTMELATYLRDTKTAGFVETKAEDFNEDFWTEKFLRETETDRQELVELVIKLAQEEVDAEPGDFAKAREAGIIESSDKIANTVPTLRADVQKVVRENTGLSDTELSKLIFDKVEGISKSRADMIARTTVTATTGATQKSVWDELGGIKRSWAALSGARAAHAAAHDTLEDDNGLFTVGGEQTPYPAGGGLSAANSVNCRCFARARRAV